MTDEELIAALAKLPLVDCESNSVIVSAIARIEELSSSEEAENEAKDCFWAIYPDWCEMKGHGITTEAARTMLSERIATLEKALRTAKYSIENGGGGGVEDVVWVMTPDDSLFPIETVCDMIDAALHPEQEQKP